VRALLQRVTGRRSGSTGAVVGEIGRGLLVLLGVARLTTPRPRRRWRAGSSSSESTRTRRAGRTSALADVGGAVLVVSQFTLYADTRRGRRPGFTAAAGPAKAAAVYEAFCSALEELGVPTARGRFGAAMEVELVNDGPFTIWLDTPSGSTADGAGQRSPRRAGHGRTTARSHGADRAGQVASQAARRSLSGSS